MGGEFFRGPALVSGGSGEIGAVQRLAQQLQLDLYPARIRPVLKRRTEAHLGR